MHHATLGRLILIALLCAGVAPSGAATVGTWQSIEAVDGLFSIPYKNTTYAVALPNHTLDNQIWYYDGVLVPQNPVNIEESVERQYELLAGDLTLVAYCNNGAPCTSGSTWNSTYVSSFTSNAPFDYLAVHLGQGELLFHWAHATSSFVISGLPTTSISNYRAFLGPEVIATPLPGTAALLAPALLGLFGWKRMRKTA